MSNEGAGRDLDIDNAKILIVDDVPKNIQVLGSTLRSKGYQVIPATSGEQALRAAATHTPDLILLDVMMPEMDGYQVFAKLKENGRTADIPVIFVTALTDEQDETKGLEMGAVDYITKPIKIPVALARVRTHLALRFAYRKLEEQNEDLIRAAQLREDVERMSRHDLKQPLTSIIGMPQVIKTLEGDPDEQARLLDRITESGYRMLNMVNLSLDLYKMEQGTYEPKLDSFDVIRLIRKVFSESERTAEIEEVGLALKVRGTAPSEGEEFPVLGEELLSYSMLSNLVKNAVEASPRGETVAVSLDTDGELGLITVHNQGAVPEEIRDRFFEKYSTSGKQRGTGLGTYSARLMAETQRGSIALESTGPEGTTVVVRLPRGLHASTSLAGE